MRKPKYISYSALRTWRKDKEEYALRHLVDNKPPRSPQEAPAAVGSSFDAWVKADLHAALFGPGSDAKYEFSALFEAQVEPQNRDAARDQGLRCFDNYVSTGAYDDLLNLMKDAKDDPQFEFDANATIDGVPIIGFPDCRFLSSEGILVILDWKVKGYCSKWGASPSKNYRICRDGLDWPKPSRSNNKNHKGYKPFYIGGLEIGELYMESNNADWATQLSMYGWMAGQEPGDEEAVVMIDEIVSKSRQKDNLLPLLRVANHRARISKDFQMEIVKDLKELWECVQTGHIIKEMSREDSDAWFEAVQMKAVGQQIVDDDPLGDWYSSVSKPEYRG